MTRVAVTMMMLAWTIPAWASDRPDERSVEYGNELLVQISVSDLEKSIDFYGGVLGLELDLRNDELKWAKFVLPTGARLGIGESDRVEGSGTTSINISVRDLDAARETLEAAGVEFTGPTLEIPGVVRLADFEDPDGNRIRLAGAP